MREGRRGREKKMRDLKQRNGKEDGGRWRTGGEEVDERGSNRGNKWEKGGKGEREGGIRTEWSDVAE